MTGYPLEKDAIQMVLGLKEPWFVKHVSFSDNEKRLDIYIDFHRGAKFPCPSCGTELCDVHDTIEKEWRHLDFFQYPSYIHARVPRIECDQCGVIMIDVPWSRKMSAFTFLFDHMVVLLAQSMQISKVAEWVNEHDTRIWRIVKHYVKKAFKQEDYSNVTAVCVDETSERKGHNYITIFADKKTGKVLFVTRGKDSDTIGRFFTELLCHHGDPWKIEQVSCDMSPAFICGISEYLVNAKIIFDKFHVMQLVNKAIDEVRRAEQKENSILKKTRYIWLKSINRLTEKQNQMLFSLRSLNLKTARSYQMKLNLQEFWKIQDRNEAHLYLKRWYFWLTHSRLEPMISLAKTIRNHWEGILNYFECRFTNALMEGVNSVVQSLKRSARGYKNTDNFITMIYLRCGKLNFEIPT